MPGRRRSRPPSSGEPNGVGATAEVAVRDRMFRGVAVLRVVVLLNALGLNLFRADDFVRPTGGIVVGVVMVAWTAVATWGYAAERRRTPALLVSDLGVAVGAMATSPWLKGEDLVATVPGFWVMAAMLAWAIQYGWRGGLLAAACVSLTDVAVRESFTQVTYSNLFLLMIGGPIVGYLSESLQQMAAERDRAERESAAAAERARLARAVHDGVLQVLALVQRRGVEAGGPLAELGRVAGDQEAALRSLIRQQDALQPSGTTAAEATRVDLASALEALEAARPPRVSVATPGTAVLVPATVADEVVAAVQAGLDNVARHVGQERQAWVLLEDLGDRLVVTVRDDGPGIVAGRLDEAVAQGRLGVSESIRGRIRDLGGEAELVTGPHGTEWELTLPR